MSQISINQPIIGEKTVFSEFTISIKDCITLCKIVDDFDVFIKNISEISKSFRGLSKLKKIYKYIKSGNSSNVKTRNFYLKNYKVLDIINEHAKLLDFLFIYYNIKYKREIIQMHEYLKKNKEHKDKILENLEKLSNLGFGSICFAEDKKFDSIYEYNKIDNCYYYLDGEIEIIPNIDYDVKYKAHNANYEIVCSTFPLNLSKSEITLNNLIFNSECLPDKIVYDETMKKIFDLRREKNESYKALSDSVCLDSNLEKIIPAIEKIDEVIISINNCRYQHLAKRQVDVAKMAIYDLKGFLTSYENDLIGQNLLSEETLEEEKTKYKKNNG